VQHPNDPAAWVQLAQHYEYEGDLVADDPGDEDHRPGDPTSWYEEALDSFNRAIELGARGFDVHFSRAELADAIGQNRDAVIFAQETLRLAPGNPTPREADQVKSLHEIFSRNVNDLPTFQEQEKREQEHKIRDRRWNHLPRTVRRFFDAVGNW